MDSQAFGGEGLIPDNIKTEESKVEDTVTSPTEPTGDVENKVPYSRFETVNQRALDAEREAESWRLRAEELSRTPKFEESKSLSPEWIELYGDSEASKKAWAVEQRRLASIREEMIRDARREALEAVREERVQEQRGIEENVETIDSRLESLQEYLKRPITESEESALLDIVDEFTPKDEDGNYAGDTISFGKAWQIYEMQQAQSNSSSKKSRNNVVNATGRQSQGEPSNVEADKNWNPLDWKSWKNKV